MNRLVYWSGVYATRGVMAQCVRSVVLHRERLDRPGPFIIAATHVSHTEPAILSSLLPRPVRWVGRSEMFRQPRAARWFTRLGVISVRRAGVSTGTFRSVGRVLGAGGIVGIFPEGGVLAGDAAAFRGGRIKRGVCVMARRAQAPIVPVVVLGTQHLNAVRPYLPFRRGRVWINIGPAVAAKPDGPHRLERERLAGEIESALQSLYRELLDTCGLSDHETP